MAPKKHQDGLHTAASRSEGERGFCRVVLNLCVCAFVCVCVCACLSMCKEECVALQLTCLLLPAGARKSVDLVQHVCVCDVCIQQAS